MLDRNKYWKMQEKENRVFRFSVENNAMDRIFRRSYDINRNQANVLR